jgi:antitoxin component YwqK of YwqJK toxin-antitoxin module
MKNIIERFFLQIVYLIFSVAISGCSSIILIENSSQDGQLRYYAKNSKFAQDTTFSWALLPVYPNGNKKFEVVYKNGKKNGRETQWDAFGYKIRETDYKNDQKNGIEIFWTGNGIKKRELHYKKDLQNGIEITFSENGQKIKEESYVSGKKEGFEYGYDSDGRKIYEVSYKNGKKDGQEIFYNFSCRTQDHNQL